MIQIQPKIKQTAYEKYVGHVVKGFCEETGEYNFVRKIGATSDEAVALAEQVYYRLTKYQNLIKDHKNNKSSPEGEKVLKELKKDGFFRRLCDKLLELIYKAARFIAYKMSSGLVQTLAEDIQDWASYGAARNGIKKLKNQLQQDNQKEQSL